MVFHEARDPRFAEGRRFAALKSGAKGVELVVEITGNHSDVPPDYTIFEEVGAKVLGQEPFFFATKDGVRKGAAS